MSTETQCVTKEAKMRAYHGQNNVKEEFLDRVKAHRKADEIVQRSYWENGKGCAVGCTIHGNSHKAYEVELGIPEEIAYLEDALFEGMSITEAKKFPAKFLEAIPVGADLSNVVPKFLIWILTDEKNGAVNFTERIIEQELTQKASSLLDRLTLGEKGLESEFKELRRKSRMSHSSFSSHVLSCIEYSLDYPFPKWKEYGAEAAKRAARAYACYQVGSDHYSGFAKAEKKHSKNMADKLLELLAAALTEIDNQGVSYVRST